MQRGSETALQRDLGRIAALAGVVDLDATLGRSADRPEIDGGDILDKLLGGRGHRQPASRPSSPGAA